MPKSLLQPTGIAAPRPISITASPNYAGISPGSDGKAESSPSPVPASTTSGSVVSSVVVSGRASSDSSPSTGIAPRKISPGRNKGDNKDKSPDIDSEIEMNNLAQAHLSAAAIDQLHVPLLGKGKFSDSGAHINSLVTTPHGGTATVSLQVPTPGPAEACATPDGSLAVYQGGRLIAQNISSPETPAKTIGLSILSILSSASPALYAATGIVGLKVYELPTYFNTVAMQESISPGMWLWFVTSSVTAFAASLLTNAYLNYEFIKDGYQRVVDHFFTWEEWKRNAWITVGRFGALVVALAAAFSNAMLAFSAFEWTHQRGYVNNTTFACFGYPIAVLAFISFLFLRYLGINNLAAKISDKRNPTKQAMKQYVAKLYRADQDRELRDNLDTFIKNHMKDKKYTQENIIELLQTINTTIIPGPSLYDKIGDVIHKILDYILFPLCAISVFPTFMEKLIDGFKNEHVHGGHEVAFQNLNGPSQNAAYVFGVAAGAASSALYLSNSLNFADHTASTLHFAFFHATSKCYELMKIFGLYLVIINLSAAFSMYGTAATIIAGSDFFCSSILAIGSTLSIAYQVLNMLGAFFTNGSSLLKRARPLEPILDDTKGNNQCCASCSGCCCCTKTPSVKPFTLLGLIRVIETKTKLWSDKRKQTFIDTITPEAMDTITLRQSGYQQSVGDAYKVIDTIKRSYTNPRSVSSILVNEEEEIENLEKSLMGHDILQIQNKTSNLQNRYPHLFQDHPVVAAPAASVAVLHPSLNTYASGPT